MIEILNRWTRAVMYSGPAATSIAEVVAEAMRSGADLTDADLTGAVLRGADLTDAVLTGAVLRGADLTGAVLRGAVLRGADLTGAVLRGADLTDADLTGADLTGADLTDAVLTDADLTDADLTGADLTGADLTDAVLTDAVLRGADLRGAVLTGADLRPIRDDFWAVIASVPAEIPALRSALAEGRVNGSTYIGDCACLVGTIANARQCAYDKIPGLAPNGSRPAERFFLGIRTGDTPETSAFAKLALEWLDDFDGRMRLAYSPKQEAANVNG